MSHTEQLLDALRIRNFDDRGEKLGNRQRDKACAALEGMKLTRDRMILRGSLKNLPQKEFFVW